MPRRRRAVPERVNDLRRRLRDLPYGGRTRVAVAARIPRWTIYAYTAHAEATRVPRPETLEALLSALNTLYPEVQPTMTTTQFLPSAEMAEVYAAPVFEICDLAAHLHSEYNGVVDLDRQVSDAVFALGRGETLEASLSYIKDVNVRGQPETHPAADQVRAALAALPPLGEFMTRAEVYGPIFDKWHDLNLGDVYLPFLARAVHDLVLDADAQPDLPHRDPDFPHRDPGLLELRTDLLRLHGQVRGAYKGVN